jgi:hypothetical protein
MNAHTNAFVWSNIVCYRNMGRGSELESSRSDPSDLQLELRGCPPQLLNSPPTRFHDTPLL